jgi:rubrerythrin
MLFVLISTNVFELLLLVKKSFEAFKADQTIGQMLYGSELPFIALAAFVVLPGFTMFYLYSCKRCLHQRRQRDGLCGHCGYDLRETPARCPECGKISGI